MSNPITYTQSSFEGGMNLLSLDTNLQPNQYIKGINVRSRFGDIEPIKAPIEIKTGLPDEIILMQGLYSFGSLMVVFVDGLAFYRLATASAWVQIAGFAMSEIANRIYCCGVPQSSLNYSRTNIGATPSAGVTLESTTIATSPVALVVQDGINQPWLIFSDGTARISSTYDQWDVTTNREYIPIGLQMVYFDGILFLVSADKKRIYRSVSGRPLDFVIAIDNGANKISDAEITSFAVDSNEINLLTQLNTDSLIVGTAYSAYSVTPDFTPETLLYGEPIFSQIFLFTAGVSNQFCFADILGDFAFIDKEGLKSFNGVIQLKFEGNNTIFSLSISKLFNQITQDDPCVGSFDNYTFFAVKTSLGNGTILVYDNINKCFPSVDILSIGTIKQFASTYTSSRQRFFVMTTKTVYELYPLTGSSPKTATIFTKAFDSMGGDQGPTMLISELKTQELRFIFERQITIGILRVAELVEDEIQSNSYDRNIPAYIEGGILYPVGGPCIQTIKKRISNIAIPVKSISGTKLRYCLIWTGGGKLRNLQLISGCDSSPTSRQQASRQYTS